MHEHVFSTHGRPMGNARLVLRIHGIHHGPPIYCNWGAHDVPAKITIAHGFEEFCYWPPMSDSWVENVPPLGPSMVIPWGIPWAVYGRLFKIFELKLTRAANGPPMTRMGSSWTTHA